MILSITLLKKGLNFAFPVSTARFVVVREDSGHSSIGKDDYALISESKTDTSLLSKPDINIIISEISRRML